MLYKLPDMLWANRRPLALGALALVVVGAAAAGAGLLFLRAEKSQFLASRLNYLSVVADLKAGSIRDFHRERLSDLTFYSSDPHLTREYRSELRGEAAAHGHVTTTFASLISRGAYESVALVDRRGRLVLALPAGVEPPQPSTGPAGAPRLLGARRTADGGTALDYEAATVDGARLLFRVHSWLSPLVERWPGIERTAETLIFQRDGKSLLALSNFRHTKNSALALRVPLDSDILAARAARGEAGPMLGLDYRRVPCYAAVRDMPELGWILVVKADEEELLAPLRDRIRMIVLAAVGLFGLLAALLVLFLRAQDDRHRAEADAERHLLSTAIEQTGESIIITDKNGYILYTNPAFTRATGYSRDEMRGKTPAVLKSGRHDAAFYKAMWETLTRGEAWTGRIVNRRKNGALYEEDAAITPVLGADGAITHYIAVKRDVSAVKTLEEKLLHSQKMEAIGRLAGGVAHDFNNILTTINGYAEMLGAAAPPDSELSADLAEILGAGRRAALLTRQLLTFSRRAPADPVLVDLRVLIRAMEKMFRRTLGEDVRLALDLPGQPLWVRTDPGQIDQVLMNLAVNARDAMPRGGALSIRAYASNFETEEMRMLEAIPAGRYATLVVADDGAGMDGAVLARLFEPFFTTKEKDKGTGLGLATVFGIVKQSKGYITVDSAPGRGSTFTVHLPLVPAPIDAPASDPAAAAGSTRGDETVLVVEDQGEVLRLVARALTPQGYRVIACGGAAEALKAARAVEGPIHLLLTDVVMPGMDGEELAGHLRQVRPETRVLYMSGYTDGRLDKLSAAGGKVDLLLKPFTPDQVCRRVRDALDGAAPRMA